MAGVALSHYASASQRRLDLVERSLAELAAGRLYEAYVLADMSCRSRVPAADDLLLRGEIAARLGFPALERADVEAAFAIDPSSVAVQLRMLEMLRQRGEAGSADALARAILRLGPQPGVLAAAIAALKPAAGCAGIACSHTGPAGFGIAVFSAEPRHFAIELGFESSGQRLRVSSEPDGALASVLGASGSIAIAWPEGARTVRCASEPALDWVGPAAFKPFHPQPLVPRRQPGGRQGPGGSVTVIMPVYADIARTRACIDSVLSARSHLPQRLVLVDDRGPDPALRTLLADYARQPDVALIINPVNLGFIGSINRALLDCPKGDVVLLNSDTIVAPGWLERLARAAHSCPGGGTATPLSNNGELTSLPAPFEGTQMPSAAAVAAIDHALSRLQPGRTVALPNGVGFCLYITEACRAAGILNDVDFREGYLEEVEYCLRASELGFSHVCACDVFVGHAGGRSFQERKRPLVAHNLARLERAFPDVRAATQRFIQADPLRPLRFALQKRLLESAALSAERAILVIGWEATPAAGAPENPAVAALERGDGLLRLSFAAGSGGCRAMLHRDGAMAPHRLPLEFDPVTDPLAALLGLLRHQAIARIVYLDAHHPCWARDLPRLLAVDYDVHAVDDSVLGSPEAGAATCEQGQCADWAGFLAQARRFVSASPRLAALASQRGLRRPEHEPLRFAPPAVPGRRKAGDGSTPIAIFLNASDATAWRWVRALGRAIMRRGSGFRLVVFGATLDDDGLRRTGAVTVTATPSPVLAPATFALHGCIATIALIPGSMVEHPHLDIIAQGPRPLLSWNRHLPDVLGCETRESLWFSENEPADGMLEIMDDMLRDRRD